LKILTGKFKGRAITLVASPGMRPTADKVRKAVFDTLQDWTKGKAVLDLYSGTGAMGLEALSQGASSVRFVEVERAQARRIEDWLERYGLSAGNRVDAMDATRAIERASSAGDLFDLVIMDAPYKLNRGGATLSALFKAGIVRPGGFVVVECGKLEKLPEECGTWKQVRDRRYGQTRLVFYKA
jgi:16S rRNA (guanine966-N2)-methyltransferase